MGQGARAYTRIAEEDKASRRAIADATTVLRKAVQFNEHDRAKIRVTAIRLPSGDVVGLVDVLFEAPWLDERYCVSLPTAGRFKGFRQDIRRHVDLEIIRLNKAAADAAGTVVLADGTILGAVRVIPAQMPLEPSELDWKIVHATLSIIPGGDRCYRSWREGMSPELQYMIPDQRLLDCSKLHDLKDIPPLKDIVTAIGRDHPTLKVSSQKIADALRAFGIRVPVPRPRIKVSGKNA
jgi:hypothetical protein